MCRADRVLVKTGESQGFLVSASLTLLRHRGGRRGASPGTELKPVDEVGILSQHAMT